ncbi:MAG: rhomboid family intramembrane serine protease [candidate division KSB1 bacterium]|jgi:rhomboid protease GluP|nr:rhomboid family intramembrane serine protease [candidate division KSB1 bacterium]
MADNNDKRAILCPSCGKLINSDAEECIHCGYKRPGRASLSSIISPLVGGDIGFIQITTVFCVALYILSILIDPSALLKQSGLLSFLSPSIISLDRLGMTGTFAISQGRWWTLVTAIYLHGSLIHIFFNLWWIRSLGPTVEELFGTWRLILIFTISGVIGFTASTAFGIQATIGASGSIFGFLGALIFYGRDRGGTFGQAMYRQLITWAIFMFVFGLLFPRVDNWAHAGGFIGGYLSAMLLGYSEKKQETIFMKNAAAAVIIGTVVCFLLAFWNGFIA